MFLYFLTTYFLNISLNESSFYLNICDIFRFPDFPSHNYDYRKNNTYSMLLFIFINLGRVESNYETKYAHIVAFLLHRLIMNSYPTIPLDPID